MRKSNKVFMLWDIVNVQASSYVNSSESSDSIYVVVVHLRYFL